VFIMAGIGVHDDRNRCSPSVGIGVHDGPEYAFATRKRLAALRRVSTGIGMRDPVLYSDASARMKSRRDKKEKLTQQLKTYIWLDMAGLMAGDRL
jgi:hypothetical protein